MGKYDLPSMSLCHSSLSLALDSSFATAAECRIMQSSKPLNATAKAPRSAPLHRRSSSHQAVSRECGWATHAKCKHCAFRLPRCVAGVLLRPVAGISASTMCLNLQESDRKGPATCGHFTFERCQTASSQGRKRVQF